MRRGDTAVACGLVAAVLVVEGEKREGWGIEKGVEQGHSRVMEG